MVKIALTQGKYALIDDCDYELVTAYKWRAHNEHGHFYALANDNQRRTIRMHRLILGLSFGDSKLSDHINHDGLDNCRRNLRICTRAENVRNSRKRHSRFNYSSKYKGVSCVIPGKRWSVAICVDGDKKLIGRFDNELAAAQAYDNEAIKYHGDFACLNFPNNHFGINVKPAVVSPSCR